MDPFRKYDPLNNQKAETPVADARLKQGRPYVRFNDQPVQAAIPKTNPSGGGFNLINTAQEEAITPKRPNTRASSSPLVEPKGPKSPMKVAKQQNVKGFLKSPYTFPKPPARNSPISRYFK